MITFTILVSVIIAFVVFVALSVIVGGAAAIIIFGDLIICAGLIYFIIRFLLRRR